MLLEDAGDVQPRLTRESQIGSSDCSPGSDGLPGFRFDQRPSGQDVDIEGVALAGQEAPVADGGGHGGVVGAQRQRGTRTGISERFWRVWRSTRLAETPPATRICRAWNFSAAARVLPTSTSVTAA